VSDKAYRIVRLAAENLKRLHAVEVNPNGSLVEVTGRNGNGKSSLLDAIVLALGGGTMPKAPIRVGEDEARIEVDLGDYLVIRRFKRREDGSILPTLTVQNAEGAKYSSGQAILTDLIGRLAFDPLEFTRLPPKEQFDTLKQFVPDFDFNANAGARKAAFDERTDVNRDLKNLKSQVAGFSIPSGTPDEEINIDDLTAELEAVGKHNTDIEARKANRERVADEASRFRSVAQDYRAQADEMERRAKELRDQATEAEANAERNDKRLAEAGPLPEPKDPSTIRARIEAANIANATVRDKKRMDQLIRQAEAKEAESKALTGEIERLDAAKLKAIAEAKMPVDGIGFADDYLTLNGLPFDQASGAEQLRASVAVAIAANPKLRVLVVKDGALLDDDSMKIVAEMAEKHDCQIWLETVTSDRPGALVIEDGRLAHEAPVKVAAE
jgi:DNA repair exonuclease SbcCD ATPase subunit